METLAIALLGFFAAGYFVVAGTDIGTGMLVPYLGRDDAERRLVLTSFAPFFLGNEVWLVATAGVFIGCFPELEGELFSGQFGVLIALLAGWIVRDMGLWLRGRAPWRRWRAGCDGAVVCGSWTVALSWGWLLAALFSGTPGSVASGPVAVLTSLAVAVLFCAHGLGFAALRLTGAPFERARRLVGLPVPRQSRHTGARQSGRTRETTSAGPARSAPAPARGTRTGPASPGGSGSRQSFALTCVLMAALPLLAGRALPLGPAAADRETLGLLVPVLLTVTPLLCAVQAWTWHAFRHRVTGPSYL
ncbi:cytochrome d ubiquinol oxidase subunit II [Streptomyces sp. NPDC055078]